MKKILSQNYPDSNHKFCLDQILDYYSFYHCQKYLPSLFAYHVYEHFKLFLLFHASQGYILENKLSFFLFDLLVILVVLEADHYLDIQQTTCFIALVAIHSLVQTLVSSSVDFFIITMKNPPFHALENNYCFEDFLVDVNS